MLVNYLTGVTSPAQIPGSPTQAYGTQANPLNIFYGLSGATGNKTTNKDLPQWLRDLGMKGDAYAGGMLKPEIRYGFKYKDGKIYFADGTYYAAKKTKGADGKAAYSYTGSDGVATSYSPTDEQNTYNKAYKDSTSNQSFIDKAKNTLGFELWHGGQILKNIKPSQVFFGIDPLGTKIGNAVTGANAKPLVDQLGGALGSRYDEYGKPTGFAKPLQGAAHVVAGLFGAQGAANGLGNLVGSLGSAAPAAESGGIGFGGASTGGIPADLAGDFASTTAGGGAAGQLAAAGGISGGAGIGGTTAGALGSTGNVLNGLTGANSAGGSMGWGDWVNLTGQLYGSYAQGQGAKDAANASAAGSAAGLAEVRRQYDQSRQDQLPWMISGTAALGRLNDPDAFTTSPGYDFVRGEGNRGVENSFAARGGALSGNAARGISQYNQNLASQEYNNWFNQQSNLAGLGQTSAQSLGSLGANSANSAANLLGQQGNARASGIEGQTNALTGGISDFLSWYNNRKKWGG